MCTYFFPLGISLSGFLSHDGVDYLCERVCISVYVGWQLSGVHICRAVGIWGQGVGVIPFPRFGRNRCKTSSFDRPWISTCPAVNIRPIQDRATLCNELQNEIAISWALKVWCCHARQVFQSLQVFVTSRTSPSSTERSSV